MFMTIEKAPHPEQTHLMSKVPPLSAWGDPPRSARVFLMALRIGTATALGGVEATLGGEALALHCEQASCHCTLRQHTCGAAAEGWALLLSSVQITRHLCIWNRCEVQV